MTRQEKIIFMGTPNIAASVLERLLEEGRNVTLVVTQPDRQVGRKKTLTPPPVKVLAQKHGIPVFQPERIRKDHQPILDEQADLAITCAYGQIVPQEVLDAPRFGCVNLHGSILPEYRGAAPIQRAIWDGKTETGMSLMKMEAGMDTGPVLDVMTIPIEESDTSSILFDSLGKLAGELMIKNLDQILSGEAVFTPQENELATYAAMLRQEDEEIRPESSDDFIRRQIRALADEPGAYIKAGDKKLKILEADYLPGQENPFGLLKKEGKKAMSLQLHDGKLMLKKVQLAGKGVMDIRDFVNGAGRAFDGLEVWKEDNA